MKHPGLKLAIVLGLNLFYTACSYSLNVQMPVSMNTKGQLATGLVSSMQTQQDMAWMEANGASYPGKALKNILPELNWSIGAGLGWQINATRALKAYVYRDRLFTRFQGSLPTANRDLAYQALVGGIAIHSPYYSVSLNLNKNTLRAGLWQYVGDRNPASETYDLDFMAHQPAIRRYYFDLFRHKLDLIEHNNVGFNAQVQWHYSKRLSPFLGAYYNQAMLYMPIACYQYYEEQRFQDFPQETLTCPVGYDSLFLKHVVGINLGVQWHLPYIDIVCHGRVDNFYGLQGSMQLTMRNVLSSASPPHKSLLAYRPPMRHVSPSLYTRTMRADQWQPPASHQKQTLFLPDFRRAHKEYVASINGPKLKPQLTFNAIPALQTHMRNMVAYYAAQSNAPSYLQLSQDFFDNFLKKSVENMRAFSQDCHFWEMDWFNYEYHNRGPSHLLFNAYWDFIAQKLYETPFEDVKDIPFFNQLTQAATSEQLKGIQFFLNAAHLFHTLDTGSATGIIYLARNKLLRAQKKDSSSYVTLPSDINAIIIDHLLLNNEHVTQILDQRYHVNDDMPTKSTKERTIEITRMRNAIVNTLV